MQQPVPYKSDHSQLPQFASASVQKLIYPYLWWEFLKSDKSGTHQLQAFVRSARSGNACGCPRVPCGKFVWLAPLVRMASMATEVDLRGS